MKKICFALFAVFSSVASAAPLNVEDMEAALEKSFADPGAAAITAESYGLKGERKFSDNTISNSRVRRKS